MSNIKIVIDGKTAMNSDPGQWSTKPPDLKSLQNLGGGAQPEPWMQCIMITLAKVATLAMAGKRQGDTNIEVTTHKGGWTMNVDDAGNS